MPTGRTFVRPRAQRKTTHARRKKGPIRGLSNTARMKEPNDTTTDRGLLHQELVYAGLDAIKTAIPVELCAYLYESSDQGPQLFMVAPDLGSIGPTEAFNLFTALRDTLKEEHGGEADIDLSGYRALGLTTARGGSRGLFVIGRREAAFDEMERTQFARLAGALGKVARTFEDVRSRSVEKPEAPVRVAIEMSGGVVRAEVAAPFGDEVRTGTGESVTPYGAVAEAVIDAVDATLKLLETAEAQVGGDRLVAVIMEDQYGRREVGAALITDQRDALQATAVAALGLARRLVGPT
jgi:hypothetical protein